MEGMKRKEARTALAGDAENEIEEPDDDDVEYYRSEVGQEPEKGNTGILSIELVLLTSFNESKFKFRPVYCTNQKCEIVFIGSCC